VAEDHRTRERPVIDWERVNQVSHLVIVLAACALILVGIMLPGLLTSVAEPSVRRQSERPTGDYVSAASPVGRWKRRP